MSVASVIARNGKTLTWARMEGTGGTYDPATGTVTATLPAAVSIKGVLDGFGSIESQLRAETFENNTLVQSGKLRVYTTSPIRVGDLITVDTDVYTVVLVKTVWKKSSVVLYAAQVRL